MAREFIHERRAGTFTAPDMARAAGMSRRLLEMRFRRHLDSSLYGDGQRLRLDRVLGLHANADLTLSEVAREVGFGSLAKMSTAFRKQHWVTASAFRKLHF